MGMRSATGRPSTVILCRSPASTSLLTSCYSLDPDATFFCVSPAHVHL